MKRDNQKPSESKFILGKATAVFVKRVSAVLTAIVLFASLSSFFVSAETNEKYDYDVKITFTPFAYYDDINNSSSSSTFYKISAYVPDFSQIKTLDVTVKCDADIFNYSEAATVLPWYPLVTCSTTKNANSFDFHYYRRSDVDSDDVSIIDQGQFQLAPTRAGDINVTDIDGTVTLLDGTRRKAVIKVDDYYGSIVPMSKLTFLEEDKGQSPYYSVETKYITKEAMTVEKWKSLYTGDNKFVEDKDGKALSDGDAVSTGSKICLKYDGYTYDYRTFILKGDVNCDGRITASDARLALRFSAKLEKTLSYEAQTAANYDDKQGVTAADARLILRKAAEL